MMDQGYVYLLYKVYAQKTELEFAVVLEVIWMVLLGTGARKRTGKCAGWMCGQLQVSGANPDMHRFTAPAPVRKHNSPQRTVWQRFPVRKVPLDSERRNEGRAWLSGSESIWREINTTTRETSEGIIFKKKTGMA